MVKEICIRAISNPKKKASTILVGDQKATVRVCEGDTFDQDFGILIAWVKAIDKQYKAYFTDFSKETVIPSTWEYVPYQIIGNCKHLLSCFATTPYKVTYKKDTTIVEFAFGATYQEVKTTGNRMKDFFLAYLYNIYGKKIVDTVLERTEIETGGKKDDKAEKKPAAEKKPERKPRTKKTQS